METLRFKVAGAVSLVVGGAVTVVQYAVTPLSNGNMSGSQTVAAVTEHHAAMGLALALDTPNLLALPAVLFLGVLAGARTSRLASVATAVLFLSLLITIPQLFGLDGLAFLAGTQPDKTAMAHLIDSWQNSAWFAAGLFPYLLGEIVGSILLGVALYRARTVPTWVAVMTAVWPLLGVVGQGGSIRGLAIAGYALGFVTWFACAVYLTRLSRDAVAEPALVSA